jgi:hypothetical protein
MDHVVYYRHVMNHSVSTTTKTASDPMDDVRKIVDVVGSFPEDMRYQYVFLAIRNDPDGPSKGFAKLPQDMISRYKTTDPVPWDEVGSAMLASISKWDPSSIHAWKNQVGLNAFCEGHDDVLNIYGKDSIDMNAPYISEKGNLGHYCADRGLDVVLARWIAHGGNIHASDELAVTPLQKSAMKGHDACMKICMNAGASILDGHAKHIGSSINRAVQLPCNADDHGLIVTRHILGMMGHKTASMPDEIVQAAYNTPAGTSVASRMMASPLFRDKVDAITK